MTTLNRKSFLKSGLMALFGMAVKLQKGPDFEVPDAGRLEIDYSAETSSRRWSIAKELSSPVRFAHIAGTTLVTADRTQVIPVTASELEQLNNLTQSGGDTGHK